MRFEKRPHALPRYSPVGSKLFVKPNEFSQPIVYVPPLAGEPLENDPEPTTEFPAPPPEAVVEVVFPVELFLLPHPAANATSKITAVT
jgi:hypothetical protein